MNRALQSICTIGLSALAMPWSTGAGAAPVNVALSTNSITDIYISTFDGSMGLPADPYFGGTRPPTMSVIVNPMPTGVAAGVVPQGISPTPAAGSFLDLTLGGGNTNVTLGGGVIAFPDFQLKIDGTTFADFSAAGMVLQAAAGPVALDANGVAVIEVGPPFDQLESGIKADFSTFVDVLTSCAGPLCSLIPILTLDMIRYQLIIDYSLDFSSFTASFQGQTANNSMLYATLNAVPIPAAVWLFGSALGLLGWLRRKAA